jgi:hypothetical protein
MLLFSSELRKAWVFLGISLRKSIEKPMPSQMRRILNSTHEAIMSPQLDPMWLFFVINV